MTDPLHFRYTALFEALLFKGGFGWIVCTMAYRHYFLASRKYCCDLSRLRDWSIIVFVSLRIVR